MVFHLNRTPDASLMRTWAPGVEILRGWEYNVTDVWECSLVGKPDENIWRFCQKERRTILTHDDDFMDHRLFPLRKSFGVVVLPHKESNDRGLFEKT
jgi:predicted nuclease of predicted toxin-antitoxin system